MIEILKGNYGECRICDNTDPTYGMPSLKAQSWQLCLTDYPYNVNYHGKGLDGKFYDDAMNHAQYLEFCQKTYAEISRISAGQLIFCGNPNLTMWIKYIAEPRDVAIHYKPNTNKSRAKGYSFALHDSILIYGKAHLQKSVYKQNVEIQPIKDHPCPNNPNLYKQLLLDAKAVSVIDPFLGSGTTALVCEELGIPWLGYEINPAYIKDIQSRIQNGITLRANQQLANLGEY